jgi:SulP family sulfate permease
VFLRTTRPHTALLGQIPGTHVFRNVKRFPEAVTEPGVIAVRIDAQFYFGNVNFLRETLRKLEHECDQPLKAIVINASSINQIDSSADSALHEMFDELSSQGIAFFLAEVRGPVRDIMRRSGFEAKVGKDRFFLTMRRAMKAAVALVSKEQSRSTGKQAETGPQDRPNGARIEERSDRDKADEALHVAATGPQVSR